MNSSRTAIYSDMLTLQARLQFPFERHFYSFPEWGEARTVLDFGSGNAAYASILNRRFPGKTYYCVEQDDAMRAAAAPHCTPNIHLVADLNGVPASVRFDFVLLRLVLLHVADRRAVYDLIDKRSAQNCGLLVFDAEDDLLAFDPVPDGFVRALSELRAKSKNRRLRTTLSPELGAHRFALQYEDAIVVNNTFPHVGEDLFKYMYRTAELGVGSPLPQDLHRELVDWWLANPYVQYGFFGQFYRRTRSGE